MKRPCAGLAILLLALAGGPSGAAEPVPAGAPAPAPAGTEPGPRPPAGPPGPRERCPVCGMFVAGYPEWLAAVRFRDGTLFWFDGAKDLCKLLLDVPRHAPGRTRDEVEAAFVTDYYELGLIDARTARYVVGGDVQGPMGLELIPHATLEAAEEYRRDHRGLAVVGLEEVDAAVLGRLEPGP